MSYSFPGAVWLGIIACMLYLQQHDFAEAILAFYDLITPVAFLLVTFSVPRDSGSMAL